MKKVLMIAFHYPPYFGGSGIQRTLKFCQYLPEHGWEPIVLTANPTAYPQVSNDPIQQTPGSLKVTRAFALDSARQLAVRGVYLRFMALPDRWISWWPAAVFHGMRLVRKYRPEAIWSTYPIATAHLIGLTLHRLTGIPWIADFRDSMTEDCYPPDFLTRTASRWVEKQTVSYSTSVIFTAQSTLEMYLKRYSGLSRARCAVIPNGYDERDFEHLVFSNGRKDLDGRPVRLLHAGLIYPEDRDPRALLKALSRLKRDHLVSAQALRVDLRASGSESYYSGILADLGLQDIVHLLPPLPYREALQDCNASDALLLLQGASCNHQIPAKAYEYLRLQKPILALTSERGDTAALLRQTGGATIVELSDEGAIYHALPYFLNSVRRCVHPLPDMQEVQAYARKTQVLQLASCLSWS